MEKQEIEARLGSACGKLGEFFDDYLVLIRHEGGFVSRTSDHCWAIGAAGRYIDSIKTDDAIELKEFRRTKEGA